MRKIISSILLFTFIIIPFSVFSQISYAPTWLVLDDEFEARWTWTDIGDNLEGRLYRSGEIQDPKYKVLILCAKKSSSYILAFNKLIDVVEKKLPSIEFHFFSFNKNSDRASEIVEYGLGAEVDLIISMIPVSMVSTSSISPVVGCLITAPSL